GRRRKGKHSSSSTGACPAAAAVAALCQTYGHASRSPGVDGTPKHNCTAERVRRCTGDAPSGAEAMAAKCRRSWNGRPSDVEFHVCRKLVRQELCVCAKSAKPTKQVKFEVERDFRQHESVSCRQG